MSIASPVSHAPTSEARIVAPYEDAKNARRGLRLTHLWAIVPLVIAWFAGGIDYIEPYDFWWNVKSGEIMAQAGKFLSNDVLVWSPVRTPYSNPQWGSQLLFYWIYSISPYLLLTVRVLIIVATMALLLRLCAWRSGSLRAASLATLLAYLTGTTNYGMRPQLFAFLPFLLFFLLLELKDTYPRLLPLMVPVMLFWVNVHGSFFLGIALVGLYALGTFLEKVVTAEGRKWLISRAAGWQALWFALAGLASIVNPYTLDIYRYFFIATNDPIARAFNIEWQAPTLYEGTGVLFYLNLFIFLATLYISKRRLRLTEILLVLAFGYLALTSIRNVMWWGWVTAPMIATNLTAWAANRKRRAGNPENGPGAEQRSESVRPRTEIPAFNWVLGSILVGGAMLFTPLWRPVNPLVPVPSKVALAPDTPTKIADFLKSGGAPAPIFNYMEWGGYLEWALYPRYQMFVDGRFEARQVDVWRDYLSVSHGRADWQQTLDRYKVKTLVLSKEFHADLIPLVSASSAWRKVYEDKTGVVYTR